MKGLRLAICALALTGVIFFVGAYNDYSASHTRKVDVGNNRQRVGEMQASQGLARSTAAGSPVRGNVRKQEKEDGPVWYRALHAPEIEKNAGHGHD